LKTLLSPEYSSYQGETACCYCTSNSYVLLYTILVLTFHYNEESEKME
jgi:hypothetical protein